MMRRTPALMLALLLLALGTAPRPLRAQTLEDADFMGNRVLCASLFLMHDSWNQYWEGGLKRSNGNIGTITMQEVSWMGAYGVTRKLTIMASVPYVKTTASQGPLEDQRGVQDLVLSAKYKVLSTPLTSAGTLHVIAVGGYGTPMSDYTPDFLPLSIGLGAKRVISRGTLSFQAKRGWYVNGSTGYTWRSNVKLDRPAYYTDGHLTLSDEVHMPDVADYVIAAGYKGHGFNVIVPYTTQRTLGGGDIRRQDMPFVSNRMNFSKIDVKVQYTLPMYRVATVVAGASQVLNGRNVGQSKGYTFGLILAGRP